MNEQDTQPQSQNQGQNQGTAASPGVSVSGVSFKRLGGELEPEASRLERDQQAQAKGPKKEAQTMMSTATVRLGASVSGRLLAELSGFKGWEFSDQELADLSEVWSEVQIPVSPMTQALGATLIIAVAKVGAWMAWKKTGGTKDASKRVPEQPKKETPKPEAPKPVEPRVTNLGTDLNAIKGLGE